mgnify:CR=1 FL=1|jgi:hypothetical protein
MAGFFLRLCLNLSQKAATPVYNNMEKINGKIEGSDSLVTALGNKKSVAGVSQVLDYKILISKMPLEKLYRHGLEEFGIKPNRSIKGRESFEKKCISAFRKTTGQLMDRNLPVKKMTKSKQKKLKEVLKKGI